MGKLSAEEIYSFEEHFVDCPQCIGELQATKGFVEGMERLAAEQFELDNRRRAPGLFRAMSRSISRNRLATLAAAIWLAILVVALVMIIQTRSLRSELAEAKAAAARWQQMYENAQEARPAEKSEARQVQPAVAERIARPEGAVPAEDAGRTDTRKAEAPKDSPVKKDAAEAANSAGAVQEEGSPTLTLNATRGAAAENAITLAGSVKFTVQIPLEGETKYDNYRVTIRNPRRQLVHKAGAQPDNRGVLRIALESRKFNAGVYYLALEGTQKGAQSEAIGEYRFTVETRR